MTTPPSSLDMQATLATALAGRYTVTRELGRGGMATVFLADDLKHQRQVAIKVLLPELGAVLGAERFLSEIRVTANLQHPNLLPLFDSGDANGLLYYVMPYVEGETLRARLDREQQLPVEEAVRLARTMASALDYAHQRGVIHRDLKPENVLLQAGQPVIADFGIALAVAQAGGQRVTQTGLSLGTPQYMSPEQATGDKQLDGRTDIYALGAMTYEMLTGEPPHIGQSAQAIIAKLMTEDVRPMTVLRRSVPANVDAAVRRALEKLPADRFATAGAFAMALGDGTVSAERYLAPVTRNNKRLVGALAGALLVMMASTAWLLLNRQPLADTAVGGTLVARFGLQVDPEGKHALGGAAQSGFGRPATNSFALSPDGSRIVYAAWDSVGNGLWTSHLYERRLGEERVHELAGSANAAHPVFSPDGKWIAFTTPTSIARMPIDGGDVQVITVAPNACCLSWSRNDTLAFSDSARRQLQAVAATGGQSRRLPISVPGDSARLGFLQPFWLPSGTLLFHVRTGFHPDSSAIYRFVPSTGKTERLLTNAADPKVLGHEYLLFARRGTLMAVRFDEATATVLGEPVLVVDDVQQSLNMPNNIFDLGIAQYAVSEHNNLVYARGGEFIAPLSDLVRVRSNTPMERIAIGLPNIYSPRLSPSEDRIAFSAAVSPRANLHALFVHDLQRHVTTRLAEGGVTVLNPVWSSDGRSIASQSTSAGGAGGAGGTGQVFVIAADGSGAVRPLVTAKTELDLTTWSTTGVFAGVANDDIWTARDGEEAQVFFVSKERELFPTFSPDGRWLAYSATKGNRSEVFVRPYPGPGSEVQISGDGGNAPAWSRDGRMLYFMSSNRPYAMMRVAVATNGLFTVGRSEMVLPSYPYARSTPFRGYDLFRDGSVLGVTSSDAAPTSDTRGRNKVTEFHVVLNFLSELRARVR